MPFIRSAGSYSTCHVWSLLPSRLQSFVSTEDTDALLNPDRGDGNAARPQPPQQSKPCWFYSTSGWRHTSICNQRTDRKTCWSGLNQFISWRKITWWVNCEPFKCIQESVSDVHAGVRQGNGTVNAAERTQVLLEKAISKCKLFFSQLGNELSGRHQRDVGFY